MTSSPRITEFHAGSIDFLPIWLLLIIVSLYYHFICVYTANIASCRQAKPLPVVGQKMEKLQAFFVEGHQLIFFLPFVPKFFDDLFFAP